MPITINGKQIKAFLFDLDGVLVDSEREYSRIWDKIGNEFGVYADRFSDRIKGTTLENILETYFPDETIRDRVRIRLYEEENAMVYLYCSGAKEFLDRLKSEKIPMALYTSSNGKKMEHLYRDIPGIKNYFDYIVTGDNIKNSKPDPEGYLLAARMLNIDSSDCCVVEDSLQGVKAGRAAGGSVVGVAGTLKADVLQPYSDKVVCNLMDLL